MQADHSFDTNAINNNSVASELDFNQENKSASYILGQDGDALEDSDEENNLAAGVTLQSAMLQIGLNDQLTKLSKK